MTSTITSKHGDNKCRCRREAWSKITKKEHEQDHEQTSKGERKRRRETGDRRESTTQRLARARGTSEGIGGRQRRRWEAMTQAGGVGWRREVGGGGRRRKA